MKPVLFFGAGGHAMDITDILKQSYWGSIYQPYYLSDDESYDNNKFGDIVGSFKEAETLQRYHGTHMAYIIAINNSELRQEIYEKYLKNKNFYGLKVIHPTAYMSSTSHFSYDADFVIGPLASIGPNVTIGYGAHINSGVTINQSCKIGNFATLSPGVNVCGDVVIGDRVQFGAGGVVINDKKIGDDVIVGSGSVIISDVSDNETVVGVPAKPIKTDGQIVWG